MRGATGNILLFALASASLHAPAKEFNWSKYSGMPLEWFASGEGIREADNILSYQFEDGSWTKGIDMASKPCSDGDRKKLKKSKWHTFDNGSTHSQMRFMARAYAATKDGRYRASFEKGLDYIFSAQYESGGWPQRYPLTGTYGDHITFNDNAMASVLKILRDVVMNPEFEFVDAERKTRAGQSFQRGIECILKCQIEVNGTKTAWCAQHDAKTLAPVSARPYEKISLSGNESVGLVDILMSIENPSPEVRRAVAGACEWFERSQLKGIRWVSKDGDRTIVEDPAAPPLWARFYDIETNRPIFCGRDGVIKFKVEEIEKERRTGYSWYGEYAGALLSERWPAWRAKWEE